jgi:hypothetical protein
MQHRRLGRYPLIPKKFEQEANEMPSSSDIETSFYTYDGWWRATANTCAKKRYSRLPTVGVFVSPTLQTGNVHFIPETGTSIIST